MQPGFVSGLRIMMRDIDGKTQIHMAPMEGITTALFRRVYRKWFKGTDRVYTPFLVANQTHCFKNREKKEFDPFDVELIPQILTDRAEHFLWAARELKKAGYREINLNAGCPSGTVTAKRKGAGMLADLSGLRSFFDEVFAAKEKEDLPEVSVKTRVGMSSYSEAEDIASVYAEYPFSKVIVHPRIRDDYYDNKPDPDAFRLFYDKLPHNKIVYNGDLKTPEDAEKILALFPGISGIMLGRGLLSDPFLPERICEGSMKGEEFSDREKERLLGFLEELYRGYEQELSEGTALLKMKDIWNFMADAFPEQKKQLKSIKKSRTGQEYLIAVRNLI